ncbi:MAG: STAS domain-containing protein [Bacteroidota bacterium]|nr:STAS domain-containing protein [Bacteroidota bacterium]
MTIKSKTIQDGKIAIIELRGALIGDDLTDEFRDEVADYIEQGNKCMILNMKRVNYLNSSGIGALITAHTSYRKIGGEIKLIGLSSNIQNLMVITRLIEVFDAYETIEEAIKSFSTK